jgi:hypothetical protein
MLRHYVQTGELDNNHMIKRLGVAMLSSERLTFIGWRLVAEMCVSPRRLDLGAYFPSPPPNPAKYKEFLEQLHEGHAKEAAATVTAILTESNMSPKW